MAYIVEGKRFSPRVLNPQYCQLTKTTYMYMYSGVSIIVQYQQLLDLDECVYDLQILHSHIQILHTCECNINNYCTLMSMYMYMTFNYECIIFTYCTPVSAIRHTMIFKYCTNTIMYMCISTVIQPTYTCTCTLHRLLSVTSSSDVYSLNTREVENAPYTLGNQGERPGTRIRYTLLCHLIHIECSRKYKYQ